MSEKVCETAVSRCKFGLTKLWQLQERNQKGMKYLERFTSEWKKNCETTSSDWVFWGDGGNPSGCLLIFCSRSLRSRGVLKNPEGSAVKKKHGTSWNIVSIFWRGCNEMCGDWGHSYVEWFQRSIRQVKGSYYRWKFSNYHSICIRLLPSRLFKIDHTPASIRIR